MIFQVEISDAEFSHAIATAARHELGNGQMRESSPFRTALHGVVVKNVSAFISAGTASAIIDKEIVELVKELVRDVAAGRLRALIRSAIAAQMAVARDELAKETAAEQLPLTPELPNG